MRTRCTCTECGCLDDATKDDTLCAACKGHCRTEPCGACGKERRLTRRQEREDRPCAECRYGARINRETTK